MTCFACEQEPTQQCPRCGRPYCDDHGEDVCDACLEPASGLPSFTLYRGSLLVLLVGTVLAVWLILQPPGNNTNAAIGPLLVTPTPVPTQAGVATTPGAQQTAGPQQTPGAQQTPGTQQSPAPTATRATGTATPANGGGSGTYTVVSGDTLSSICEKVKPASMSNSDCVDRIRSLNSLSGDGISIGQVLQVPK
jgi:Tfp pilus assembly protein FimV